MMERESIARLLSKKQLLRYFFFYFIVLFFLLHSYLFLVLKAPFVGHFLILRTPMVYSKALKCKSAVSGMVASGFCRVLAAYRSSSESSYDPLIKLSSSLRYLMSQRWNTLLYWSGLLYDPSWENPGWSLPWSCLPQFHSQIFKCVDECLSKQCPLYSNC